eukprot:4172551-Pyramimonas_sp.AAC.1
MDILVSLGLVAPGELAPTLGQATPTRDHNDGARSVIGCALALTGSWRPCFRAAGWKLPAGMSRLLVPFRTAGLLAP